MTIIDNNTKMFFADFSELADRFDPTMVLFNRKSNSFKYQTFPLKSLLLSQPQYGANESGIERTNNTEPRYIRITDIDEFGLLDDSIGVTANTIEEKYVLQNNDILFARSGATVGKAYLHKTQSVNYKCFFAGYMIRFVVDESKILADYLFAFTQLNTYKEWVKAIQRAAGQPNINAEEYKSLKIPVPTIETQKEIVIKINTAYNAKKQKEAKAKELLVSIDTYILQELDITLPEKTIGIESRIFIANYSDINGSRFDPIYNNSFYNLQETNNVKIIKLGHLINVITKGETPLWRGDDYVKEGVPFLQVNNLTIDGVKTNYKFIPYEVHNRMKRSILKGGEILFTMAGSIGLVTVNNLKTEANINQAIAKIIVDDSKILKSYLVEVLNSQICKLQINRYLTVAAQPNINFEQIKSIKIPVPSLEKQNEITNRINSIRLQVKKLQSDATDVLEMAKQEVEQMILGK